MVLAAGLQVVHDMLHHQLPSHEDPAGCDCRENIDHQGGNSWLIETVSYSEHIPAQIRVEARLTPMLKPWPDFFVGPGAHQHTSSGMASKTSSWSHSYVQIVPELCLLSGVYNLDVRFAGNR